MLCSVLIFSFLVTGTFAHGRLRDPPSRSSAWRDGFNTPTNWNDNELYCGGFTVQWNHNGGKCGICGDPWNQPQPRSNELGGTYGKGIITRTYKRGQVIDSWIELTQNHRGWYELRLCPLSGHGDATQECFDRHVLQRADGSGGRIPVPSGQNNFRIKIKLPDNVVCDHCVIQWHYYAGNRWDYCPGGGTATGCGPQETFRGCADVRIQN